MEEQELIGISSCKSRSSCPNRFFGCGSAAPCCHPLLIAFAAAKILIDRQATMGCHPVCPSCKGNTPDMRKMALVPASS
jgi:hypothetical protein